MQQSWQVAISKVKLLQSELKQAAKLKGIHPGEKGIPEAATAAI